MKRDIKERWELTSDGFQETSDVSVGCNWGWDGVDDEELLADISGADVLELGCGGGQDTVGLAEHGANVTGVDLTRQQLHHALDLFEERDLDIDVVEGDVTALPFAADEFDLAYNTYVFQWVPDLPAAFAEAHRVLGPDGRFVFSMPHPLSSMFDPESHELVESYFDTGEQVTHDGREDYPDMVTYRRTISDVYNALVEAGFAVERLLEPGSADPDDYEPGPWGNSPPELQAKRPGVLVVAATAR
jgi:ubiquinone/menaquinone biosynthesis C-methylase UbiE